MLSRLSDEPSMVSTQPRYVGRSSEQESDQMRTHVFNLTAIYVGLSLAGCGSSESTPSGNVKDSEKSGFIANTPEQNAQEVLSQVTSTPQGRATVDRLASKDDQLTAFQRAHGISDSVAEAAIKEWVIQHNGNFDYNLEAVKAICLRMKRQ